MIFSAWFTEDGTPKTGLTPKIYIRKVSDVSLVVNGSNMTEVGNGWYKYDYVGAVNTEDYAATADSVSLLLAERYAPVATSSQGEISDIKTKTDTIDWADITYIIGVVDAIQAVTDTIDWTDIDNIIITLAAIQAKTDTIEWGDITTIDGNVDAIKLKTDTIVWSDITAIKTVVDAIKLKTDTIDWTDITAIKAVVDAIQAKTDTIVWADVTFIRAIQEGNWTIENNQMIFYETDGSTVVATYNLFNAFDNPAMEKIYKREKA